VNLKELIMPRQTYPIPANIQALWDTCAEAQATVAADVTAEQGTAAAVGAAQTALANAQAADQAAQAQIATDTTAANTALANLLAAIQAQFGSGSRPNPRQAQVRNLLAQIHGLI
jgi:hypothetical protein